MHNLSHHSVVIQVPFPEGTGKLAMTVMPLFNSSLKIYEKPQFGRLKGCIYKPGLIHTLFVYALVLHCPFLFSFFLFFLFFSAWEVYSCWHFCWMLFVQGTKPLGHV